MAFNILRLRPDGFTLALLATLALASVAPARGWATPVFGALTSAAIMLLFFLHGAKLSREAILGGVGNWRLHLAVLASTFVLFPVLGVATTLLPAWVVDPQVAAGVLYMTLLPSTVQSSIAFTSIARGDVPAAVCSASASNLIGIVLTPLLVGLLMHVQGASHGVSLKAVGEIVVQILLPFVAGHLSRPLTAGFLERRKGVLTYVDRGSILLVVYTAFSAAVVEGLWSKLGPRDLIVVFVLDALILGVGLTATRLGARALRFSTPEEITIVFCGSKKSLASGVPMAGVLFPAAGVGVIIVPLMIFHQIQLMVCAVIARRYGARTSTP